MPDKLKNIKMGKKSLEKVVKFKLQFQVENQNYSHEHVKSKLSSGNLATDQFRNFCLLVCYL
jgi:hypothetical protein